MALPTAVIFDLYETLVTEFDSAWTPPVLSDAARLGLASGQMSEGWASIRERRMRGHLDYADALRELCRMQRVRADESVVAELFVERKQLKARPFQSIDSRIVDMLETLTNGGTRLAVMTNADALETHAWHACPLAPHFEHFVVSAEIGYLKPEREIYEHTLALLGIGAGEAAFVGDGGADELRGARNANIKAYFATWFLDLWPSGMKRRDIDEAADFPRIVRPQDLVGALEATG